MEKVQLQIVKEYFAMLMDSKFKGSNNQNKLQTL